MVKIAPSILSADFTNLESEIKKVEKAGADLLHIDVMDGHFVPNITIGQPVVSAIRKKTKLPLDVHLMIEEPEIYLDEFIDAGADCLTVHLEACRHLHRAVSFITKRKVKAGVALNPATPLDGIKYLLSELSLVLLMTVNPGFGGQDLIPSALSKIAKLNEIIQSGGFNIDIEVDGGINKETAPKVIKAGANILVAGYAVYQGDARKAIKSLRGL
ncbi:ribulose-phosphate 3-epimerase [Candidatus Desantisbacteria bacterium CG1_02_38_46]|uniref:Ribulose-phosphate 3-epimerase n=1 Tax=Candidatus Desantisbacteria bacterium CG1_02_38_46 TaxID=1817893 RepID=A0A1J4SIL6_9BACT|nr:MAG: ribulose-phosphate 3-epimerase [Candidatus Desantisbacteria bacterium CG1_02_38_46]